MSNFLAAVPTGSGTGPCCCICNRLYGEVIEVTTSDIEVCACTQVNDALSDFDGQDLSIVITAGSLNGVNLLTTWNAGLGRWEGSSIANAEFTVWSSTDGTCTGDELYTEVIPVFIRVPCNASYDGEVNPVILAISTNPELGTWTFFASDQPGGFAPFSTVFGNIFTDCSGAFVAGFNGQLTLADEPE